MAHEEDYVRITIDDTDFAVFPTYVREVGVNRYYEPADDLGYRHRLDGCYKLDSDGRRISILSYEGFGCIYPRNVEAAQGWRDRAREAWQTVHGTTD